MVFLLFIFEEVYLNAKFVVEDDFWSLFPNARIGVVVCHNINNSITDKDKYKDMILISEKETLKHLKNEEFSSNEVVKVWREAFQKFNTKKVLDHQLRLC